MTFCKRYNTIRIISNQPNSFSSVRKVSERGCEVSG